MGGEKCEILQGCIKQSCQKWETFPSFFFSRTMLQQNSQFNTLLLLYTTTLFFDHNYIKAIFLKNNLKQRKDYHLNMEMCQSAFFDTLDQKLK